MVNQVCSDGRVLLDVNSEMIICSPVLFICFIVLLVAFGQFMKDDGLLLSVVAALFSWIGLVVTLVVFPFKVSKAYYSKYQERYPNWLEGIET